jgi:hypothetical protein
MGNVGNMPRARRKGYAPLLKDTDVKRWNDNVASGSSVTAGNLTFTPYQSLKSQLLLTLRTNR